MPTLQLQSISKDSSPQAHRHPSSRTVRFRLELKGPVFLLIFVTHLQWQLLMGDLIVLRNRFVEVEDAVEKFPYHSMLIQCILAE